MVGCSFLLWRFRLKYNVLINTWYIFLPLIPLPCCSQVAELFTLIADFTGKPLLLKRLHLIATRKLRVKIVECKLQNLVLRVIRKGVRVKIFFALKVQTFQQCPRQT